MSSEQIYFARQANGGSISSTALTGTIEPNQVFVIGGSTSFASAYGFSDDQFFGSITGNGNDGYFLYFGGNHTAGTLFDSYGVLGQDGSSQAWEYVDSRAVRNNPKTTSPNATWTTSEWTITTADVADMTPGALENEFRFDGDWKPSEPSGSSTASDDILITSGDASVTSNTSCNKLNVSAGASLSVNTGVTLTVADVTDGLTLESNSLSYSSLLLNGTISGTVNYKRFTNVVGTGLSGGNDLISLPLIPTGGQTFDQFIALGSPANSTKLATDGSDYAFGPYENASSSYTNYATTGTDALLKGKGYRAATTLGESLTFSGDVETGNVSIDINIPGGGSQWNLIGNPYPCYLNTLLFLAANSGAISAIDPYAVAIYGYNDGNGPASGTIGNFTIVNNATNSGVNIAPGQGFFVAAANAASTPVVFNSGDSGTTDMRTITGTNDFILTRNSNETHYLSLEITSNSENYRTEFYFNDDSSLGLDPGYDASVFGTIAPEFSIYSHLVQDNIGRDMAIQSLAIEDISDVVVPLGINANQGEQLTISIQGNSLSSDIKIYLEDNFTNQWTLLNANDYVFTPTTNLNGTGRFFVHFTTGTLSAKDTLLSGLQIFADNASREVVIKGQLNPETTAFIYDLQGRQVLYKELNSELISNKINVNSLSSGLYIVELSDYNKKRTQKVIIK